MSLGPFFMSIPPTTAKMHPWGNSSSYLENTITSDYKINSKNSRPPWKIIFSKLIFWSSFFSELLSQTKHLLKWGFEQSLCLCHVTLFVLCRDPIFEKSTGGPKKCGISKQMIRTFLKWYYLLMGTRFLRKKSSVENLGDNSKTDELSWQRSLWALKLLMGAQAPWCSEKLKE